MKLSITGSVFIAVLFCIELYSQDEHKWKPVILSDDKKIWIDESSLDTVKGDKFEVWLLQMYVPTLKMEGITGDIYRAKTLYTVDLTSVKYGIKKIFYFDAYNKELFDHDYKIDGFEDKLKFTYPVLENSTMHYVIKELYKNRAEKNN